MILKNFDKTRPLSFGDSSNGTPVFIIKCFSLLVNTLSRNPFLKIQEKKISIDNAVFLFYNDFDPGSGS